MAFFKSRNHLEMLTFVG